MLSTLALQFVYNYQQNNSYMQNAVFQDVISLLMDIKITLQKHKTSSFQQILKNIDLCISKIAPLIHVYAQNTNNHNNSESPHKQERSRIVSHQQTSTFKQFFTPSKQNLKQKEEQLNRVNKSFIQGDSQENGHDIIDYFMLKYDLKLQKYLVLGRKGGQKADRQVFLDLFTFDKNNLDMEKVEKSNSMTKLFKLVYNSNKIKDPFILPNCQGITTKYLFVFELNDCGFAEKDFYRISTLFCFITRSFVLAELTHLMDLISKTCFQQQISQISPIDNILDLEKAISGFNTKKYFASIENIIEKFVYNTDFTQNLRNLTESTTLKWQFNTLDKYLQKSSVRLSFIKKSKSKEQKWYLTLVIIFYFVIFQHKIIFLSQTQNKAIMSQLMVALLEAISPLTYIYPIVAATISSHHMQFINSPVPLCFGTWGGQQLHQIAKSNLKRILKVQKEMSPEQLTNQTLMVIIDIQDQSVQFLQSRQKETIKFIDKIQTYIQAKFKGSISNKLSCLMLQLLDPDNPKQKAQEWLTILKKAIQQTQMYEYFINTKT